MIGWLFTNPFPFFFGFFTHANLWLHYGELFQMNLGQKSILHFRRFTILYNNCIANLIWIAEIVLMCLCRRVYNLIWPVITYENYNWMISITSRFWIAMRTIEILASYSKRQIQRLISAEILSSVLQYNHLNDANNDISHYSKMSYNDSDSLRLLVSQVICSRSFIIFNCF